MKRKSGMSRKNFTAVMVTLFLLICAVIFMIVYTDGLIKAFGNPEEEPTGGSPEAVLPGDGQEDIPEEPDNSENPGEEPLPPVVVEPEPEPEEEYVNLYGEEYSTFPLPHESESFMFTEKLIEIARSEPAEAEDANGATKYGRYFGHASAEWCTEFAVWCVIQTEEALGLEYTGVYYPKSDYSGGCVDWFSERGLFFRKGTYVPRRGDFIIFDYDYDGITDHTGIVTGVEYDTEEDKLYILTIEGNLPEDYPTGSIKERRLAADWKKIYGYGTFIIPE